MGCNCGGNNRNAQIGRLVKNGGTAQVATTTKWRVTFSNGKTFIDDSLLAARRVQRKQGGTLDAIQEPDTSA